MRKLLPLLLALPLVAHAADAPTPASAPAPAAVPAATSTHALSLYGDPLYGPDFTHFKYTNPEAPKGGTVRLGAYGGFDSFNPFIIKGEAADGVGGLVYETLMVQGMDEPFTEYGLLAKEAVVAPDNSAVTFTLNPAAKFSDGTPVTAQDVVWSFNTLMSKGAPQYGAYYGAVQEAKIEEGGKVTFTFKTTENRELPLILGQLPVLPEHAFKDRDFAEASLALPIGSGPYKVKALQANRDVVYERRADYWGANLPSMKGRFNFDEIRYDYYRDLGVMFEAFKAGDIDFRTEFKAANWAVGYDIPAIKDGRMIKEGLKHEDPQGMQGFYMNTRRPAFADVRVRKALAYGFDFAWTNTNLFYGQYTRSSSYFSNSDLASSGVPEGRELAILEQFRDQLPPELFTTAFTLPETKGDGDVRENLKIAQTLLKEAGYEAKGGVMTNTKTGEKLAFEVLIYDDAYDRVLQPYARNLERLGIKMSIRKVDSAQYINRMNAFDFDMTLTGIPQSLSPGNEQFGFWSSQSADMPGSPNVAGVKSPVVDALIAGIVSAPTRDELAAHVHALDRVLLWNWYTVPNWHTDAYRVAYWNRFGKPAVAQKHGMGFLDTWWVDTAKDASLKKKP